MELDEIKELRKHIREVLLNSDDLTDASSVQKKMNFEELKNDAYTKVVDAKNIVENISIESDKHDVERVINAAVKALTKLKVFFSNNL